MWCTASARGEFQLHPAVHFTLSHLSVLSLTCAVALSFSVRRRDRAPSNTVVPDGSVSAYIRLGRAESGAAVGRSTKEPETPRQQCGRFLREWAEESQRRNTMHEYSQRQSSRSRPSTSISRAYSFSESIPPDQFRTANESPPPPRKGSGVAIPMLRMPATVKGLRSHPSSSLSDDGTATTRKRSHSCQCPSPESRQLAQSGACTCGRGAETLELEDLEGGLDAVHE